MGLAAGEASDTQAHERTLLAVAPGTAGALVVGVAGSGAEVGDVAIAATAGAALLHGDLAVYAHHPDAQMGPLALVLAGGLPRLAFVLVVCALLPVFLALAVRLGVTSRQATIGGVLLAAPWGHLAATGHADDPLVLLGAAAVLVGLRERSDLWVLGGFVLAMAGKPTAVLLLGLVVLAGWRPLVVGVAAAGAVWAPLVVADVRGFLSAGQGIALVQPWSGPDLLGAAAGESFPVWVRPVQLIGCLGLAFAVGRWRGPAAGLVVAVAFRVALEPGAWPSYCASLVAVAVLVQHRWQPAIVGAATAAWGVSWLFPLDATSGTIRMLLVVVTGGLAVVYGNDVRPTRTRLSQHR